MIEATESLAPCNDRVMVWQPPMAGLRYSIGVDAATGMGGDYTAMSVFTCIRPFEQVAWFWNNRVTTPEGSRVMLNLARWYNNALLVIETRYPGNAYQDNALDPKFAGGKAYGNCYHRIQTLDEDPNMSSKFGICTTEADKHLLVNETKALLENPEGPQFILNDPITVAEFCNYVYVEDKNKMGAPTGANDDTVMSSMLALHGCIRHPQAAIVQKPEFDESGSGYQKRLWTKELDIKRTGWKRPDAAHATSVL